MFSFKKFWRQDGGERVFEYEDKDEEAESDIEEGIKKMDFSEWFSGLVTTE